MRVLRRNAPRGPRYTSGSVAQRITGGEASAVVATQDHTLRVLGAGGVMLGAVPPPPSADVQIVQVLLLLP